MPHPLKPPDSVHVPRVAVSVRSVQATAAAITCVLRTTRHPEGSGRTCPTKGPEQGQVWRTPRRHYTSNYPRHRSTRTCPQSRRLLVCSHRLQNRRRTRGVQRVPSHLQKHPAQLLVRIEFHWKPSTGEYSPTSKPKPHQNSPVRFPKPRLHSIHPR